MKISVNTKRRETTAWIFPENQKSNISAIWMNVRDVTDNRSFWKSVKLYFSNKGSNTSNISLVENDDIITSDSNF